MIMSNKTAWIMYGIVLPCATFLSYFSKVFLGIYALVLVCISIGLTIMGE